MEHQNHTSNLQSILSLEELIEISKKSLEIPEKDIKIIEWEVSELGIPLAGYLSEQLKLKIVTKNVRESRL